MARNQVRQGEALRKARERQRELDRKEDEERAASRARVAEATARAILAMERRHGAEEALALATVTAGKALRELLAEGLDVERTAALMDIDAAAVRRVVKIANAADDKAAGPTVADDVQDGDGVAGLAPAAGEEMARSAVGVTARRAG